MKNLSTQIRKNNLTKAWPKLKAKFRTAHCACGTLPWGCWTNQNGAVQWLARVTVKWQAILWELWPRQTHYGSSSQIVVRSRVGRSEMPWPVHHSHTWPHTCESDVRGRVFSSPACKALLNRPNPPRTVGSSFITGPSGPQESNTVMKWCEHAT